LRNPELSVMLAAVIVVLAVTAMHAQTTTPRKAIPQGASPANNSPSLDETLKWLTDFFVTATGGKTNRPGWSDVQDDTSLHRINGCQIEFVTNSRTFDKDGKVSGSGSYYTVLSLSDIDPQAVIVTDDVSDGYRLAVKLSTRNQARIIKVGQEMRGSVFIDAFVDRAHAERAANAFRHAVELCANAQPF
jgi:hypothetical protein